MDLNELEYLRQKKLQEDRLAEDVPVETPMLDPLDALPIPGSLVGKAVGKVGSGIKAGLKNAAGKIVDNEAVEFAAKKGALESLANPHIVAARDAGIVSPTYKKMMGDMESKMDALAARAEAEAKKKIIDIKRQKALAQGIDPEAPTLPAIDINEITRKIK